MDTLCIKVSVHEVLYSSKEVKSKFVNKGRLFHRVQMEISVHSKLCAATLHSTNKLLNCYNMSLLNDK